MLFFFSSIRRHTSCALVTGVQTCALPIFLVRTHAGEEITRQPFDDAPLLRAGVLRLVDQQVIEAAIEPVLHGVFETFARGRSVTPAPSIGRASCRERVCQYV